MKVKFKVLKANHQFQTVKVYDDVNDSEAANILSGFYWLRNQLLKLSKYASSRYLNGGVLKKDSAIWVASFTVNVIVTDDNGSVILDEVYTAPYLERTLAQVEEIETCGISDKDKMIIDSLRAKRGI